MPDAPKVFATVGEAEQALQPLHAALWPNSRNIKLLHTGIATIRTDKATIAEQAKRIGEHCACNWFVARAMGGGWIHEDGTECAGAACNVPDPDRHNIIVDLRRVIAAQEAALDMTEERREIKRLEQVNATLKSALRRAPCQKPWLDGDEQEQPCATNSVIAKAACCQPCLAHAEQPEGDGR